MCWSTPDCSWRAVRDFRKSAWIAYLQVSTRPERVEFFEIQPLPISSREIRARVAQGEPIDDLVPPAVAKLIEELGLYRDV